jgi:hypothetical protein
MGWSERVSDVASLLAWLLVIIVPIGVGVAVQRVAPGLPVAIPWLCGFGALTLSVMCVESVGRLLALALTAGRSGRLAPNARTDEQQAAHLLSAVLVQNGVRASDVLRQWPASSSNSLILEAFALLRDCEDQEHNRFDQRAVNANLPRLADLMNRLRAE